MKYYIKREIANDTNFYRYFAEDENGKFIDGTVVTCQIEGPQSNVDKAVDIVIRRIKATLNLPELIKTIEL